MMSLRIMQQRSGGGKSEVPLEFQKQWMQCLPHLLWELKHTHATVSQVFFFSNSYYFVFVTEEPLLLSSVYIHWFFIFSVSFALMFHKVMKELIHAL